MFPTAYLIEGAKFDLNSIVTPNFQTTHSFAWGSSQQPPSYNLGAGFSTPRVLLHGMVDHAGNLQARANYSWYPANEGAAAGHEVLGESATSEIVDSSDSVKGTSKEASVGDEATEKDLGAAAATFESKISSVSKMQAQIGKDLNQSVVSLEHDYQGPGFSLNFKAINANPFDRAGAKQPANSTSTTGIFSASYLQALTNNISIGAELVHQHPFPDTTENSINYSIRYAPAPAKLEPPPSFPADLPVPFLHVDPKDPTQIFTSTYSPNSGVLQSTYWRKINPRLEMASELQMLMTPASGSAQGRRGGLASVGFKLETIYATIRAMVDSHGRVSTVLEEKIAPGLSLLMSAEMDYGQPMGGIGKVGFGFTLEA